MEFGCRWCEEMHLVGRFYYHKNKLLFSNARYACVLRSVGETLNDVCCVREW